MQKEHQPLARQAKILSFDEAKRTSSVPRPSVVAPKKPQKRRSAAAAAETARRAHVCRWAQRRSAARFPSLRARARHQTPAPHRAPILPRLQAPAPLQMRALRGGFARRPMPAALSDTARHRTPATLRRSESLRTPAAFRASRRDLAPQPECVTCPPIAPRP